VLVRAVLNHTDVRLLTRAVLNHTDIRLLTRAVLNHTDVRLLTRAVLCRVSTRLLTRAAVPPTNKYRDGLFRKTSRLESRLAARSGGPTLGITSMVYVRSEIDRGPVREFSCLRLFWG
jgi:hypothetical protein